MRKSLTPGFGKPVTSVAGSESPAAGHRLPGHRHEETVLQAAPGQVSPAGLTWSWSWPREDARSVKIDPRAVWKGGKGVASLCKQKNEVIRTINSIY